MLQLKKTPEASNKSTTTKQYCEDGPAGLLYCYKTFFLLLGSLNDYICFRS